MRFDWISDEELADMIVLVLRNIGDCPRCGTCAEIAKMTQNTIAEHRDNLRQASKSYTTKVDKTHVK